MKIPVVTGTGERFDLDSDAYPRLVLLPEACEGIDPRLWELFADQSADEPSAARVVL